MYLYLYKLGYGATGTVRKNNLIPNLEKLGLYESNFWVYESKLTFVKFKDKKDVCVISNIYGITTIDNKDIIKKQEK